MRFLITEISVSNLFFEIVFHIFFCYKILYYTHYTHCVYKEHIPREIIYSTYLFINEILEFHSCQNIKILNDFFFNNKIPFIK